MLWLRNYRFGGSLRLADHHSPPLQLLIILHLPHLLPLDLGCLGLPFDAIFDDVADLVNKELPVGDVEGGCTLWRLSHLQIRILNLSDHIDFRVIDIRAIECPLVLNLSRLASFACISSLMKFSVRGLLFVNGR